MRKVSLTVISIIMAFMMLINGSSKVDAAEVTSGPIVTIESYEVTNEKIIPGADFTLKLVLKNYSTTRAAEDVMIDIANPDGVAPVYGTVSQAFLGTIEPGESVEVSFDYNSFTSISSNTLSFNVTLVAPSATNYITLTIPSGSDTPFSIISANIPTAAEVGEIVSASLSFKVLGNDNVSNATMVLAVNGENVASSVVGIVTPGTTKTQNLSFCFAGKGEYSVELALEYLDDAGEKKKITVGTATVSVTESHIDSGDDEKDTEENNQNTNNTVSDGATNITLMAISGVLIIAIFLIILLLVTRRKK